MVFRLNEVPLLPRLLVHTTCESYGGQASPVFVFFSLIRSLSLLASTSVPVAIYESFSPGKGFEIRGHGRAAVTPHLFHKHRHG